MNLLKKLQFHSLIIVLIGTTSLHAQLSISINANQSLLKNSITTQTIDDVNDLLKKACNCEVGLNTPNASIILQLPNIDSSAHKAPSTFDKQFTNYPYLHYPEHSYSWNSNKLNDKTILKLETPTFQGISFGLYGLLQEQLGFKFYHPRETFIPSFKKWPLNPNFEWKANPRFDKKGFHHHTIHQLELIESFLYPESPNALENIKEFIDWSVRNQQNYFEFNLLESINRDSWPTHAKQFVDYAHSRGIMAGIDISLHMIQQKVFMLYQNPPAKFSSKKTQIAKNMAMLFEANWDVFNMEFASSEFTTGNIKKKEELRLFIIDQLEKVYDAKLMGRMHVTKDEETLGGARKKEYQFTDEQKINDKKRGILIHTVMFYTFFEEHAPVYENDNLRHMLDAMLKEEKVRETWYYPESAYWISFDNSIPMHLMSYLSSRLEDINYLDSIGVIAGHLTFSSGWEWGHWLFDWSIARWSWKHEKDGIKKQYTPTIFLEEFTHNEVAKELFRKSLQLQDEYIKDKNIIQYLSSPVATDEFPEPAYMEFQPRPEWRYKWMHRKADLATLDTIRQESVVLLEEFAKKQGQLAKELQNHIPKDHILYELVDGLTITAMRSQHKAYVMDYLLSKREAKIKKQKSIVKENAIVEAAKIREKAMEIIKRREANYRYPVEVIARKRPQGPGCYPFGYLYTASNLHYWKREEEQVKRNNYSPFCMKIVPILKNIGIVN